MPIGPLKFLGKKHAEIATLWFGSALTFLASTGVLVFYATDWKPAVELIPFYKNKFKKQDD